MIDHELLRRALSRPGSAPRPCTDECRRDNRCTTDEVQCTHCGATVLRCEAIDGVCGECARNALD